MIKIGLISDTHSFTDERWYDFFKDVDEIWHAGDIGSLEVLDHLRKFKPVRAVHGNIDDHLMRLECPPLLAFRVENMNVLMTHIGGYPGHYAPGIKKQIEAHHAGLFVCGHSHILKVMYDKPLNCLHINPGAAGIHGFHQVRTAVRFQIEDKKIGELEILEIPRS